jgi:hypothetical protein
MEHYRLSIFGVEFFTPVFMKTSYVFCLKSTDVSEDHIAYAWLCLPTAFALASFSAYSSVLKTEAIYLSETSVDFQRTTRHYIPEDTTLHA